ncbi:MAG: DsrE family protein [Planctomycetales bacterium]|nr:DsrE family protein [Planctomycetales bacterium]
MADNPFDLQIMISAGESAADRAALGFATAAAAAVSGSRVVVFLAMDGAVWTLRTKGLKSTVPGFKPIAEFYDILQQCEASIEGCSSCVERLLAYETASREEILRTGVRLAGLAVAAMRAPGVPTLTF